jgi:hypothetical protein
MEADNRPVWVTVEWLKLLRSLIDRRKTHGISTVGGTVEWPEYPDEEQRERTLVALGMVQSMIVLGDYDGDPARD